MATKAIAPSTASISRSCANICLSWVSRSWWLTASSLRATPSPWPRHTGFALSPCCHRRWACGKSWSTTPPSGSCRSCGSGRAAAKGSGRRITGPPSCAPIAGRRRPTRCRSCRYAGWWWNPPNWPRPKPRGGQPPTFACEADAHQAATLCLRELRVNQHQLTYTVSADWVPAKRTIRGRPPKATPRPQRQIWRVSWHVHEATEAIRTRARRESRFVLVTNVLAPQDLSDPDLLRADKGQPAAELSFKWAKNPAAIAPIFLETPTRIAALGCVYLLALLVYTQIGR